MTKKNTGPIQRSSSRTREIIGNFELRTTSCCWYPCALLGIDEAGTVYMILVYSKSLQEHKVIRKLRGVPRSAILYSDHDPYNLDQTIPDSILPLRWRTDYNSATQLQLGTSYNKCWSWRWMELRTLWRIRKNLVPFCKDSIGFIWSCKSKLFRNVFEVDKSGENQFFISI